MRRMRIRLLFGFLVLLALGHWQERGVLAQKYYMNFAFNNNNPDGADGGGGGGDPGASHPPYTGPVGDGGVADPSVGHHSKGNDADNAPDIGGDTGGEGGGDKAEANGGDEVETGVGTGSGYEGADGGGDTGGDGDGDVMPNGGHDDDNDDSDSRDPKNRRHKLAEKEMGTARRNDHSHHSSYEISIDDSFGGRYIRSIYESSESHGHAGSSEGSNARSSGARDSSQERPGHDREPEKDAEQEPDAGIRARTGNVPDGTNVASRAGDNDDYEEM